MTPARGEIPVVDPAAEGERGGDPLDGRHLRWLRGTGRHQRGRGIPFPEPGQLSRALKEPYGGGLLHLPPGVVNIVTGYGSLPWPLL
ncbi:hypothetical protein [Thermoflexus sp.]|uniref:hypothetical protein n=1 Tax=Thermoflexus sp. TaxID=1969742 RepID=UPI00332DBDD9